MRDYLHIWHDVARRSIVASGIEFKDFLPFLTTQGGIVLIDHRSEVAVRDTASGLDYVPVSDLGRGNGTLWLQGGSTLAEERNPRHRCRPQPAATAPNTRLDAARLVAPAPSATNAGGSETDAAGGVAIVLFLRPRRPRAGGTHDRHQGRGRRKAECRHVVANHRSTGTGPAGT